MGTQTIEGVRQTRAGFWVRTLAALIDLLSVGLLLMAIATFVGSSVESHTGDIRLAERWAALTLYLGWFLYSVMEIAFTGTIGKLLLRMQIVRADGAPADTWRLILRWSTKYFWLLAYILFVVMRAGVFNVLAGFSSLLFLIGCLYAANDDHLAWHDQWCGTAVVRNQHVRAGGFAVMPIQARETDQTGQAS